MVIAPSFGDIFRSNAAKVGMVIVQLPDDQVKELMESVDLDRGSDLTVDLAVAHRHDPRRQGAFPSRSTRRRSYRLLNGLDDIDLTLQHEAEITAYETARASR